MGLRYRTIRAAASALLVAAAVGTGGMTGMTSVLAADPATVGLTGTVVDAAGAPLAGVDLVISEELSPDPGIAAYQVTTAADGSFGADINAWGTADAPASLTIKTPADESVVVLGETCSQTWGIAVADSQEVTLADGPPDPLTLTASTTLLGEVCGTTETPPPANNGNGSGSGTGGRPARTPPPTDTFGTPTAAAPDRLGPALSIGFVVGLLAATLLLLPNSGSRRRD